jgi:hypothetical protein
MSHLLESPYLILAVGAFFLAACGYVFVNTRKKGALIGMGVALVLTLTVLAIERFIETPREQVETTLEGLADALEANDVEGAVKYLDPKAEKTIDRARWAMSRFEIVRAKISNLEIEMNETMSPPAAHVKFTGTIRAKDKKGIHESQAVPVKFTATLRLYGDRWIITEHTDSVGIH